MSITSNDQNPDGKCEICENIKNQNAHLHQDHDAIRENVVAQPEAKENDLENPQQDDYENDVFEDDDNDDEKKYIEEISLDLRSESSESRRSTASLHRNPVNKTFSNDMLREIERKNMILMKKIISNNRRTNQYNVVNRQSESKKVPSAAINRRRFQEKVFMDNQVLLRKIQSVKSSMKR